MMCFLFDKIKYTQNDSMMVSLKSIMKLPIEHFMKNIIYRYGHPRIKF